MAYNGSKKKPDPEELYEHAVEMIEDARGRDDMYDRIDALYDQVKPEPASEKENVVLTRMPYATNTIDLISDLASQMEVTVEVPAAKETVQAKKEADDQESWLRAWHSYNERQQKVNLTADASWFGAQRSMVVMRTLFIDKNIEKPARGETPTLRKLPVVLQIRDPRYCYVEEDINGPACVVEGWKRKAGEIRRMYPGVIDDEDEYPSDSDVDWIEYWDDRWVAYFVGSQAVSVKGVKVRGHGYGVLPYSFGIARSTPRRRPDKRVRPILAAVEDTLKSIDVWFSILNTAGHDSIVNAWAVFSDSYGGQSAKQLDLSPEAINYFGTQDKVQPIQRSPLPNDFFQLGTLLTAAFQQATFPLALFGQIPGQMAGYSINLLTQSGRRPMVPIWSAIERAYEGAFGNAVQIVKAKVAPIVGDNVSLMMRGESSRQDMPGRAFKRSLTLDVTKIGEDFDCTCHLSDPMPQDEASNLRMALESWGGGKGLISQETALTKFKVVPDALAEMERQQVEAIYRQLAPYEAIKLATARGYLPPNVQLPEGWQMQNGVPMPEALIEQPPQQEPQPEPTGQPNPAELQALSGQPEIMPEMGEMAGEPPPMPMIGGY